MKLRKIQKDPNLDTTDEYELIITQETNGWFVANTLFNGSSFGTSRHEFLLRAKSVGKRRIKRHRKHGSEKVVRHYTSS